MSMLKNDMWPFVTLVGFMLFVSLVVLNSFRTYHQENVGQNTSEKSHFVHANTVV